MVGHKFYISGWILVLINLSLLIQNIQGQTVYVDDSATGTNNGTSWENAFQHLQDALQNAQAGHTICVAKGIYRPDQGKDYVLGDRDATFQLKNGVHLKGGYAGIGSHDPNTRNVLDYQTVLSGDLLSNDMDVDDPCDLMTESTRFDNSHHVVKVSYTYETAILDGFFIESGQTDSDPNRADSDGAGIYNYKGNLSVYNCTFRNNAASSQGGGIYNYETELLLLSNCAFIGNYSGGDGAAIHNRYCKDSNFVECRFDENVTSDDGGGIYNYYSDIILTGCVFSGNLAVEYGGGIYNSHSDVNLIDCSFTANTADERGGAVTNLYSNPDINSCVFTDNTANYAGGGIYNSDSTSVISLCTFVNNWAYEAAGGVCNLDSNSILTDCLFEKNSCDNMGAGVLNQNCDPVFLNCIFVGNNSQAYGGGMVCIGSHPTVANCVFSGNVSGESGGAIDSWFESSPLISNCTFSRNSALYGGGIYHTPKSPLTITNCILWDNEPNDIEIGSESDLIITYSNTKDIWPGTGNMSAEPLFTDLNGIDNEIGTRDDNLRLLPESPCINSGNNLSVLPTMLTDLDGRPRIYEDHVDLGAYEFSRGVVFYVDSRATGIDNGLNWRNAFRYLQDALFVAQDGDEIHVAQGIYHPDQGKDHVLGDRDASFELKSGIRLIGGYAGVENNDPNARNIHEYQTILSGDLQGNDADILSSDYLSSDDTRLDNSYQIILTDNTNETTEINGFIIEGGYAKGSFKEDANKHRGGGIYQDDGSLIIKNCIFRENFAYYAGGAVYTADGEAQIIDCTFFANSGRIAAGAVCSQSTDLIFSNCLIEKNSSADRAGSIYCQSNNSTFTNCIFVGNSARGNGGVINNYDSISSAINCVFSGNSANIGGVVNNQQESITEFHNCTFSRNTAKFQGGVIHLYSESTAKATNCIMWDNQPENIFLSSETECLVEYSNLQDGWPGIGNISENPLFTDVDGLDNIIGTKDDNLRLLPRSPCIDAGSGVSITTVEFDLDGDPRFLDDPTVQDTGVLNQDNPQGVVDMGAYEGPKGKFKIELSTLELKITEGNAASLDVSLGLQPSGPVEVNVAHQSGDSDIMIQSGSILLFDPTNFSLPQKVTLAARQDTDYVPGKAIVSITINGEVSETVMIIEQESDAPNTLFVDDKALGLNNGLSWSHAFRDLEDALRLSRLLVLNNPIEIRVAQGKYIPSLRTDTEDPKTSVFKLFNGVSIYGGYAGSSNSNPNHRDVNLYKTILSGDLNNDDVKSLSDNAYHVIDASGTDQTCVLDGLVITGGRALGEVNTDICFGGGVFIVRGSPIIEDCIFENNSGVNGGAIYSFAGSPLLKECLISQNITLNFSQDKEGNGGGIYYQYGQPTMTDCTIERSSSDSEAGGIYSYKSNLTTTGCIFTQNSSKTEGGALWSYGGSINITGCLFENNNAIETGGGIYCRDSEAHIFQCDFHSNEAYINGGGLYNYDCNSLVTDCNFVGNIATTNGGGIYCKESEPQISQCTFQNNKAQGRGGGLYHRYSSSLVIDCNFIGNTGYDAGGAINNNYSDPVITGCTFNGNSSPYGSGAGIFNGASNQHVTDCMFLGNTAMLNGGGISDVNSTSSVVNCLFSGNRASQAGGAVKSTGESTTTLVNCTTSKNIARENGGAIAAWSESTISVFNSILWGDKPQEIDVSTSCDTIVENTNIEGAWNGIGNKNDDPLFIDEDGLDNIVGTIDDNLRLLSGSPCINSGSNSKVPGEPVDLDNDGILAAHILWDLDKNPRFIDLVDMGAYEGPQGDLSLKVNVSSISIHEGGSIEFTVALSAPPKEPVDVLVTRQSGDTDITIISNTTLTFDADNYADPQTVTLQSEEDFDYLPGTAVIAVTIPGQMSKGVTVTESDDEPAPRTLFVDWQAQGSGDGASWDNAFTDLQPALEVARLIPGMVEVYVASGTYTPSVETDIDDPRSKTFKLSSGMALYGGFAGSTKPDPDVRDITLYTTTLNGDLQGDDTHEDVNSLSDNSYHVIEASDTDATSILDGFVINGGNANQWTNTHDIGGAIRIYRGSPIIRNCRLENNIALRGGGMYCLEGEPTLTNCVISDNSVTFDDYGGTGGGIYFVDCNAVLINCAFVNNMVINVDDVNDVTFDGGGAYLEGGNLSFIGCRFMGNVASDIGGGMRSMYSNLSAVNCIFSGNIANKGAAIDTTGTSSTFTNCTVSRNIALEEGGALNNGRGNYPVLTNCILWEDAPDEIVYPHTPESPTILNYCIIQGGWPGINNLDVDPRLVDPNGPDGIAGTLDDDLTLRYDSPCIDAGNNLADTDANDIYAPGIQSLPGIDIDFKVRWHDDPQTADTGNGTAPIVDIGAYEFGSQEISPELYVNNKAREGKNNGTNWQDAFLDLQTALRTAFVAGNKIQEIWVASGTYTPTPPGGGREVSFNLVDGVGLFGGFAGNETSWEMRDPNNNLTILSGDIQGDDGLDPTNNCENSYHVVRAVGVGPETILDGFIIESGNADANETIDGKGGGLYIESASPEISNCIFWDNTAADYGSAIYASLSVPTFFDIMITDNHPRGIWLEYGQARIEGALKIFSDVLGGHDLILAGRGTIEMSWNGHLDINDTRIQCDIVGPGVIEVGAGHELVIESDATVELSNGPWGEIGQIWCDGLLHLREQARLYDADVFVSRASVEDNVIIDNCVIAAEAGAPYGQFFIEDQVEISLPAIYADGDRYLDLDPRQEYDIEKIQVDIIDVNITEGTKGTYGGLFELRGTPGLASSGIPHPDNDFLLIGADVPSFNLDSWTINKLELTPGSKLNLTNRFDFQFHQGIDRSSEVLYVKELILRENAILNTAFNTIYCGSEPIIESGARMINVPILGFSLNNITFDDASDYSTRVTDNNFRHPRNPEYNRTHVERVIDQYPDPNGMMRMCNLAELDPSSGKYGLVIPARAKGLFAKVNEDEIRIQFEYLFDVNDPNDPNLIPDPTAELIVYFSDVPELLDENDPCYPGHYLEVARIPVPDFDHPGSVGSGRLAIFEKTVSKENLDFIRGTRMELKLMGAAETCIFINNWDPWEVDCDNPGICFDFTGDDFVGADDFLIVLSRCGSTARAGLGGGASGLHCFEGPFSRDGYIDTLDGAGWDWIITNQEKFKSYCVFTEGSMPLSGETTRVGWSLFNHRYISAKFGSDDGNSNLEDLLILGKMDVESSNPFNITSQVKLNDGLYSFDNLGEYQNRIIPDANRCNIRLIRDSESREIFQINVNSGVWKLDENDTDKCVIPPDIFPNKVQPYDSNLATVYVGIQGEGSDSYGRPILDAVVIGNVAYIVPVVVKPDTGDPYVAAAQIELLPNSSKGYDIIQLYDPNERKQPNELREIEVDKDGNVYVLRACEGDDTLWKFTPDGQTKRYILNIPNPTAMHVSNDADRLYIASKKYDPKQMDPAKVYSFSLNEDLVLQQTISINDMQHISSIINDPINNRLWIVGFNIDYTQVDSDYAEFMNPGIWAFYSPYWASMSYSSNDEEISNSDDVDLNAKMISGQHNLALPISIIWTGERSVAYNESENYR